MRMFRQSTNQFQVEMTSLDGINGRSIQTLLRGENDSKQLDETQAKYGYPICVHYQFSCAPKLARKYEIKH